MSEPNGRNVEPLKKLTTKKPYESTRQLLRYTTAETIKVQMNGLLEKTYFILSITTTFTAAK